MKKLLYTLLLAVGLLLVCAAGALAADPSFVYDLTVNGQTSLTVAPGDQVKVVLTLRESQDQDYKLYAMQDDVTFDPEHFTLDEDSVSAASGFSADLPQGSSGVVRVSFLDWSAKGVEYKSSVEAATFTLTAVKAGTTTVENVSGKVLQANAQTYPLTTNNATVTISSSQGGGTVTPPATDPSQPSNPSDPTTPADPTISTDPTTPTDPVNPTTPTDPAGATDPTSPIAGLPGGGTATSSNTRFQDVPASHWAYSYVEKLAAAGIVNGMTAQLYAPDVPVSRGQFVAMLARMSGDTLPAYANEFSDVAAKEYYAPAVAWAVKVAGVTKGVGGNNFAPDSNITRQDMAVMIYRYAAYKGLTLPKTKAAAVFSDQGDIASYAAEAVSAMQQAGIINGYSDGSFQPLGRANRAETAKMLSITMGLQ